jgi:murein DD-endopeptidase MepM/ murein hydrolase activator NlpD
MRYIVSIIIALVLAPVALYAALPADIQRQIQAAQQERDALIQEQRKLLSELTLINSQALTLGTAVKSLDATRRKLTNDINITKTKITSVGLNIRALQESMTEKAKQILIHRDAIATTIRSLHQSDSEPLFFSLLASAKASDVWRDRTTLAYVGGTLEEEIDSLREVREVLDKEKEARERSKSELENLDKELSGQKKIVEENKLAQERLLAQTKSKEAEYQRMLAENLKRQQEAEAEMYQLESQLKVTLDPTSIPAAKKGTLSWPLDNVYITQRFGVTAGSARLYASGSHNGVDFRASMGTSVKAVLGGIVEGTGNTDEQRGCYSYGRWILIKHPNGLSTIYGHLSGSLVGKGQTVTTGQLIGYSGGTPGTSGAGYSTGPHLHLGLFASQGVEIRQFVTSKNCKQISLPIADTKAYLDPLAYLPAI